MSGVLDSLWVVSDHSAINKKNSMCTGRGSNPNRSVLDAEQPCYPISHRLSCYIIRSHSVIRSDDDNYTVSHPTARHCLSPRPADPSPQASHAQPDAQRLSTVSHSRCPLRAQPNRTPSFQSSSRPPWHHRSPPAVTLLRNPVTPLSRRPS